MELLEVSSGAAGIELVNLANANFSEMRLSGGAAGYELDFGSTLLRNAQVSIETGLSVIELTVPASPPKLSSIAPAAHCPQSAGHGNAVQLVLYYRNDTCVCPGEES
jgi:hypothetical protein